MGLPKKQISFLCKKWGLKGSVVTLVMPDIYAAKDELILTAISAYKSMNAK